MKEIPKLNGTWSQELKIWEQTFYHWVTTLPLIDTALNTKLSDGKIQQVWVSCFYFRQGSFGVYFSPPIGNMCELVNRGKNVVDATSYIEEI